MLNRVPSLKLMIITFRCEVNSQINLCDLIDKQDHEKVIFIRSKLMRGRYFMPHRKREQNIPFIFIQ